MNEPKVSNRIDDLKKAVLRLKEMAARPKDEAVRDSVIKRFEFTFELAWKVMKDYNESKGIIIANPKDTLRTAGDNNLIDNVEDWLWFLEERNNAAHMYDEGMTDAIYESVIKDFIPAVEKLITKLSL